MNLLLLFPDDFFSSSEVRILGRRFEHVSGVLKLGVGDTVKVGLVNDATGQGIVTGVCADSLTMSVALTETPTPLLPATLLIALPRPKVLTRVLHTCAGLGVARICLINSYRVEKSYWQSPRLSADSIRQYCILGLEQAGTTTLPQVDLYPRFKPFVEDELPSIGENSLRLVAHPGSATTLPIAVNRRVTVAIGPEGGFIPYEIDQLLARGFSGVTLGPRIFTVETAITAAISRLFP